MNPEVPFPQAPTVLSPADQLALAFVLAATGHKDQKDSRGVPYICHPVRVMYKLKTTDMELQAIALLHDYVEDVKGASYARLLELGFSIRVVTAVGRLTKLPGQTQEEYEAAVMSNKDAVRVKLQDITHNMDLRRLKGIEEKHMARMAVYIKFYHKLKALADSWE